MMGFKAMPLFSYININTHVWRLAQARLLALILCSALSASPTESLADTGDTCESKPLTFGILPFLSTEALVRRFTPLVNYLSEKLGTQIRIETAPNFVEFARRTHEEQRYDILFTAPHFYTQANKKAGYLLIASVDSPGMWAVIVVPKQSSIQTIKDLKGRRLAVLPPLSLATLLVKKHLSESGIDLDVDLFTIITPSHDASLLSSYHGVTDASALMLPPFETADPKVRDSMRIIARTESTPHIPISVAPWVDKNCTSKITTLLHEMGTTAKGKAVLRHNNFSGFRKPLPEEYRKLNELLYR